MRLQKYILRELIPPFLTGTALYTMVFLFGYFYVSSQWLTGVPLALIGKWIAYQVPDTLVKVFPMAVVLMVVVSFGRLATEREITAMQSGGLSLTRVSFPAMVLALVISLASLWLSEWVVPQANIQTRSLYWEELQSGKGGGLSQLANKPIDLGAGKELFFASYDEANRRMNAVRIQQWDGRNATVVLADSGTYEESEIRLTGYQVYRVNYEGVKALADLPESASFDAYRSAVQNIFQAANIAPSPEAVTTLVVGNSRSQSIARFADAIPADSASISGQYARMSDAQLSPKERRDARIEFHTKLALPLGNLVLLLVSLPLALRYGRTTGLALGISVIIVALYYLTVLLARSLASVGALPPEVAVWLPNLAFVLLGWRMLRA